MAIRQIPNVTISGSGASGSSAFGGHIFSIDYQVGITEASKLTISFLSEDGKYTDPRLSVEDGQHYTVSIGNGFTGDFYAYRSELTQSSQGRRLDVMFYDGSVVLDKKWVGLHKKMGDKNQRQNKTLIILGSETHPCDIDDDREFTMSDVGKIIYQNSTDPCRLKCPGENDEEAAKGISVNPVVEECKKKNLTQLLEVEYNFAELIYFIKNAGIKVNTPYSISKSGPSGNKFTGGVRDYYYANFTGSLRDVLTRWCDELALIFYWEKGGLNFMDVSKRPKINLPNFDCITDKTIVKTLEGTIGRGAITYYGREGEIYDNECADPQRQELRCLTLRDLYGNAYKPQKSGGTTGTPESSQGDSSGSDGGTDTSEDYEDDFQKDGVPIKDFEISCICSYYDERLRQQNILYNYYGIKDQKVAIEEKIGKRMDRYGGMKILDVFASKTGSTGGFLGRNIDKYNLLLSFMSQEDQTTFKNNSGYFVICELDQKKLEEQFHVERNLGANFIGKHWIKAYYQAYWGATPQLSPVGQYYAAGNVELKDLEFTQFHHANSSKVADLAKKFKKDPKDSQNKPITDPDTLSRNVLSLLYYQKNPSWTPNLSRVNPFKTLLDNYAGKLPTIVRVPTDNEKGLDKRDLLPKAMLPKGVTDSKAYYDGLSVMAMYPGYEFTVTNQMIQHLDEEDVYYQLVPPYKTGGDWPRLYYGLTSKKCFMYTINGIPVYTPAAGSVVYDFPNTNPLLEGAAATTAPLIAPQFAVMVTVSQHPHIEIPKIESTMMTPPPNEACMKIEYVTKNVNDGTMKPINKMTSKTCVLDPVAIKEFHTKLNVDMTFSVTEAFESQKISLPGLELPGNTQALVASGLENFSVRLDESSAVVSTYSFGNSLFKKVSVDVRQKALELGLKDLNNRSSNQGTFFSNTRRVDPRLGDIPVQSNSGSGNYANWKV